MLNLGATCDRLKKSGIFTGMHPKDNELHPVNIRAIWTRPSHRVKPKVVEVIIKNHCFRFEGKHFQNYEVEMISEPGNLYAAYHEDLKPIN